MEAGVVKGAWPHWWGLSFEALTESFTSILICFELMSSWVVNELIG